MASNNNKYKHIYYIGQAKDAIIPIIDNKNKEQRIEISSINFLNYIKSYSIIREYDIERKFLLYNLNNTIKSIIDIFILETKTFL